MCKRFLADNMLGRLARWLRTIGYDAVYSKRGIDSELLVNAYNEDRIVLTRNRRLYKRLDFPRMVIINSDNFRDQVCEVIDAMGLECVKEQFYTRCIECNCKLIPINRDEVQSDVPPYVFHTVDAFMTCPLCKRIFWSGTHILEMDDIIKTFWKKEKKS